MRKLLRKIIQLLDGTPAVYGKRQSGQSVVELALITPILIVLLAGLVEIGWFANNYLTLLDVTRAGARRGAVLQDQKSPLFWDNKYSYVPTSLLTAFPLYQMSTTVPGNGTDTERFNYRWYPGQRPGFPPLDEGAAACDTTFVERVFYNEVICTMITSMDPLALHPENGIDDIVVSGFSLQTVDVSKRSDWLAPYPIRPFDPAVNGQVPQVVVVGRYPSNANECDITANMLAQPQLVPLEQRDPFDFNHNSMRDVQPPSGDTVDGTNDFTELLGYDAPPSLLGDPNWELDAEKQVGFSLFGNHKIPGTFCTGSNWTMQEVEAMMNLPNYLPDPNVTNIDQRDCLPGQGLLLVELFWEHEMLLKIPLLSPVFTAVGNSDGKMIISVWAAFPLASAEPHILFPSTGPHTPNGCDV